MRDPNLPDGCPQEEETTDNVECKNCNCLMSWIGEIPDKPLCEECEVLLKKERAEDRKLEC